MIDANPSPADDDAKKNLIYAEFAFQRERVGALRVVLDQLRSCPMLTFDILMWFREYQRILLELRALTNNNRTVRVRLDDPTFFQPYPVLPVRGVITRDPRVVYLMWSRGIPVWVIREYFTLTTATKIGRVRTPVPASYCFSSCTVMRHDGFIRELGSVLDVPHARHMRADPQAALRRFSVTSRLMLQPMKEYSRKHNENHYKAMQERRHLLEVLRPPYNASRDEDVAQEIYVTSTEIPLPEPMAEPSVLAHAIEAQYGELSKSIFQCSLFNCPQAMLSRVKIWPALCSPLPSPADRVGMNQVLGARRPSFSAVGVAARRRRVSRNVRSRVQTLALLLGAANLFRPSLRVYRLVLRPLHAPSSTANWIPHCVLCQHGLPSLGPVGEGYSGTSRNSDARPICRSCIVSPHRICSIRRSQQSWVHGFTAGFAYGLLSSRTF